MSDVIRKHRFNHRILDHLNTGFYVYMPALNWALERAFDASDRSFYSHSAQPAMFQFEYVMNYTRAEVTVNVYRSGNDEPVLTSSKLLPCTAGGPTVTDSVMKTAFRIDESSIEQARITAAGNVVKVLEDICVSYLSDKADQIKIRTKDDIYIDRYQLCYITGGENV